MENYDKPQNYDHLVQVEKLIKTISKTPVKLNPSNVRLQMATQKGKSLYRKFQADPTIRYNQFGTRTGRLTTRPNSFPILTLPKKMRGILEPYRNVFLEFDVVSAEVATLFYLSDQPVPQGDLHEWINQHAFNGNIFLHNIAKLSDNMRQWGMKSNIAFVIHDSVVLDFDAREKDKIENIKKILSLYDGCDFGLHMNLGKNYGDMREVE